MGKSNSIVLLEEFEDVRLRTFLIFESTGSRTGDYELSNFTSRFQAVSSSISDAKSDLEVLDQPIRLVRRVNLPYRSRGWKRNKYSPLSNNRVTTIDVSNIETILVETRIFRPSDFD